MSNSNQSGIKYSISKIDLISDWKLMLKIKLDVEGFDTSKINLDELPRLYFSYKKRCIPITKRKILKSSVFKCPTIHSDGLKLLEQKIINGIDLRPHLSKSIYEINYNDSMLYDWGVYHLHLGTLPEINFPESINRTNYLLYAMIDTNAVYCIQILEHGQWSNKILIETIYQNWPDLIHPFILKEFSDIEFEVNSLRVQNLRKAGVNGLNLVGNDFVMSGPGGGITCSGLSSEVILKSNTAIRKLIHLQNQLKENPKSFITNEMDNLNLIKDSKFYFVLKEENGQIILLEKK